MPEPTDSREDVVAAQRLEALFRAHYKAVVAYVRRRATPESVDDSIVPDIAALYAGDMLHLEDRAYHATRIALYSSYQLTGAPIVDRHDQYWHLSGRNHCHLSGTSTDISPDSNRQLAGPLMRLLQCSIMHVM